MVEEPNGDETAFDEVYTFDTFSINARKTLAHLAKQAQAKGVNFVKQTIKPEDLEQLEGVIVNAGGIGAKTFDPTNAVKEFKGHSFVIRPEEGHMLKQAISVDDLIMIPREDGTIVCGALYIADPENPIPEEKEAEELFKRLSTLARNTTDLVSGMTPDLLEKCEVLMHSAGYRVEAKGGGIRVAPDEANERLLHAYGFAGIGWSVGPHFASVIADAANELHNKTKEN